MLIRTERSRRFEMPTRNIVFAAAFLLALFAGGCGGNDSVAAPTKPPSQGPRTEVTLPPDPTATATVAPPAPAPTIVAPDLKLRLVNVASGANTDLPIGFGRKVAWSRDSLQIAVAGDVLGIGDINGASFFEIQPQPCYAVEWSATQDLLAAVCADGLVVLDPGGRLLATGQTNPPDSGKSAPWVHWSPDGHTLAYGSMNTPVEILQNDGAKGEIAGTFVDAEWLADGRLATIEQPDYRSAAIIRIHDPAKGYAAVSEATTPAGAAGIGIDHNGQFAAFGVYGTSPDSGTPRILPSNFSVIRLSDGKNQTTLPAYNSNYNSADFSPDGRSVLAQADICRPDWSLEVASLDGSTRVIAQGGFMATKFSPDGRQVAFTRGTELWVVPSDGSAPARRLAEGVHGPAGFEWSPDSQWITVPPFFGGFDQCN